MIVTMSTTVLKTHGYDTVLLRKYSVANRFGKLNGNAAINITMFYDHLNAKSNPTINLTMSTDT